MAVQIEITPQLVIAYLSGEIDHHCAGRIREAIDDTVAQMVPPPKELYLDFGSVTFMDSSGIGLVMGRYKLIHELGGTLKIVNLTPSFKRVMKMAGMDKLGVLEEQGEVKQ